MTKFRRNTIVFQNFLTISTVVRLRIISENNFCSNAILKRLKGAEIALKLLYLLFDATPLNHATLTLIDCVCKSIFIYTIQLAILVVLFTAC